MKNMKKFAALALAATMIMGMGSISNAAPSTVSPYTSTITVQGVEAGTTVSFYKVIEFDEDNSTWKLTSWAQTALGKGATVESLDEASYTTLAGYSNKEKEGEITSTETSIEYTTRGVGGYLVIANKANGNTTYSTMFANTYDEDEQYMASKDVSVVAKSSKIKINKEAEDTFVKRGEEVTFTITTVFPAFTKAEIGETGASFKVIDTPSGLELGEKASVTIGNGQAEEIDLTNDDGAYTVIIDSKIMNNNNAGLPVRITYTGTVTDEDGYNNNANAYKNDTDFGDPGEVNGYTGDVTLTKKADTPDAEGKDIVLNGAEFKLHKGEDSTADVVKVVPIENEVGQYRVALDDEDDAIETIVATNGTVTVKGLDEGTYFFEEVKAPAGYSINASGETVTITASTTENVSVETTMSDTKLSALPSTGGIGTYIFTIFGVVLMASAAGVFFVRRRRDA